MSLLGSSKGSITAASCSCQAANPCLHIANPKLSWRQRRPQTPQLQARCPALPAIASTHPDGCVVAA